jgi:hypothetical protein
MKLYVKNMPCKEKYANEHEYKQNNYQEKYQLQFLLIFGGLNQTLFPHYSGQEPDGKIQQQRYNYKIIQITEEWNKIWNQINWAK